MTGRVIDLSSACVPWDGPYSKVHGYGIKSRGDKRKGGHGQNMWAHRWVWEQEFGSIPDGLHVHHACHNRGCVNLDHLELKDPSSHKKDHIAEDGLSGIAAVHAAKTECKEGHPFDKVVGGQRVCSICRRKASREWARRNYKPRVS